MSIIPAGNLSLAETTADEDSKIYDDLLENLKSITYEKVNCLEYVILLFSQYF